MNSDENKFPSPDELTSRLDAIKVKYREERDKRLRPEGRAQYIELSGPFESLLRDPNVDPNFTREAVREDAEVLVVGGGFGGLVAAALLREAGVEDIRIVEKGGDFGGTWYWNRYPGAACDIESYIYLPMLEQTGEMPVEKYSRAEEIFTHAQNIALKYDLYRTALFQTIATALQWDETRDRWIVRTDRSDSIAARFVVLTNGFLEKPKLPGVPGIETFKGKTFHTSRWDYGYTGGDGAGNLAKLADKRVGIIGTGATAVQCVPHLASAARHLFVFQRTPSTVGVRANKPTDWEWARSLESGWQKRRRENFNNLITLSDTVETEDLVQDGWTHVLQAGRLVEQRLRAEGRPPREAALLAQIADLEIMEDIRARVDSIVTDPATAAALKPYYNYFCKRPCFHDDYLQCFNRDNVTLVDTNGAGVERITEKSVIASGREYELDCLVYATGFDYDAGLVRGGGLQVRGRKGRSLAGKWKRGVRSLHGMQIRSFPNLFLISRAQGGQTANYTHMLVEQAKYIALIVNETRRRGATSVEVTAAAEARWVRRCEKVARLALQYFEECTPGNFNDEGKIRSNPRNVPYGGGAAAFIEVLNTWCADGAFEGLRFA